MKVTYDKEADAVYIYFPDIPPGVVETQGEWPIHVDMASNGQVAGIEILEASTILSQEYLDRADRIGRH